MAKLLNNIFGNQDSHLDQDKTMPVTELQSFMNNKTPKKYYPIQMVVATAQLVGRQRDHNEDALFALSSTLAEAEITYRFGIFIIADGMGGHQHGEIASGNTIRIFSDCLIEQLYKPALAIKGSGNNPNIQKILLEAVNKVQEIVVNNTPGGGTTLTAAIVIDDKVTIAHVGDSRAYFLKPDGRLESLTHDHSLVQRLVDIGEISEDESHVHPQRNVLYRAIGQNEPFQPDIKEYQIPLPGYLLLCSDGLWGQVSDDTIIKIVTSNPDISQAAHLLVEAANNAGGPDNISVIIVRFVEKIK